MESNKTYRVNTKIGNTSEDIKLNLNLLQNYDILEVLSLKLGTENLYKLHTSGYGCVVGRVLANGGVGVPNAKISMFIEVNENTNTDEILYNLYPYKNTRTKNSENIRYNLLPIEQISDCHQPIGTFPNKRLVLDDKNVLEIFDTYYRYTTVTNESGDYMLFGVPTGNQTFHMDIDLSDIGFLSQKPIDMMYKGYNSTLFDNSMQFKTDSNIDNLVQVVSQYKTVYVKPFWGDDTLDEIGITRNDIDVNYKFEPTCIFMGSLVSDEKSSGFSKKCIPMQNMGRMNKLTTGYGTIEMIRKRIDGSVEEFPIMGNELIDGNGVWCYQIPMNLDYVTTDEYGNLVPTDNPEIGIPTRTRVRFRVSLSDFESDASNNHLVKTLIPNNPSVKNNVDYAFGSFTKDNDEGSESFRDLFWNNVYTVKSYIPRIQKGNNQRTTKFSGIKTVNVNEGNNPIPYNNMRVNITFMFTLQCAIIKSLIFFIKIYNWIIGIIPGNLSSSKKDRSCAYIGDGLCPDLEGWYFAPGCGTRKSHKDWAKGQIERTLNEITDKEGGDNGKVDTQSIDSTNNEDENICLSTNIDYFMQCIEINLAMENEVIQFDFYNDWINGLIYLPRWFVNIRKKRNYLFGLIRVKPKIQACMEDSATYVRRYTQQCALGYGKDDNGLYSETKSQLGCKNNNKQKCHKKSGRKYVKIFGPKNGGIIHQELTTKKQNVFYAKPCEWSGDKKCNFFATDIVLLGNINKCNLYGIPSDFEGLTSSTYQMPPSLVQTNMDSDGVLYAIKGSGGISRCTGNSIKEGVEILDQTFESYNEWSKNQGLYDADNDNLTEYAVSEMSGIDWGVSGPNQGSKSLKDLYFPGGHFLGISCSNAEVNIKSCVNLSRICELGAMISQRQTNVSSYVKNGDNTYSLVYNHIIPTGFISRDEISDNNFRNIFATLNYNKLKTKLTETGNREYEFIPLQPFNFNGDLNNKLNKGKYNIFKWDNNNEFSRSNNASAYTRTIEECSKDYYYYRFGVNADSKFEDKYLLKENGYLYLPIYENSYYFYFGLKNGSTAIDKFMHDYYALCYKQSTPKEPTINVEVKEPIICGTQSGIITISVENMPLPYFYKIYKNGQLFKSGNEYVSIMTFDNEITEGEYEIVVSNDLNGITLSKKITINKTIPVGDEYNFNIDKCSLSSTNFIEDSYAIFDDSNNSLEILPKENGGVITVTIPYIDYNKKAPYVYGFIIVGDDFAICKAFENASGAEKRMIESLEKELGGDIICINNDYSKNVENEIELLNVVDNAIYSFVDKENGIAKCSLKAWTNSTTYSLYICYTCSKNLFYGKNASESNIFITDKPASDTTIIIPEKELSIVYIDSITLSTDLERFSYYLFNNSVSLSSIDKDSTVDIIKVEAPNGVNDKIANINYESIHNLDSFNEWAIKKAIYYTDSFYNDGRGSISIGINGGVAPFNEVIEGYGEYIDENGTILLKSGLTQDTNTEYSVDITNFNVPTIKWIDGDIPYKGSYIYSVTDNIKSKPYILVKNNTVCNNKTLNNLNE